MNRNGVERSLETPDVRRPQVEHGRSTLLTSPSMEAAEADGRGLPPSEWPCSTRIVVASRAAAA
jgi:hypothetical protein